MCGKNWALPLLLCLLVSPLWSQSFDPDATYRVKGSELNQLERDLLTAQAELATSETRNEQLLRDSEKLRAELDALLMDSESKEKSLAELVTQLKTVSESWNASRAEALKNDLWIGSGGVTVGALLGVILTLVLTN